ncbi:IS3 family transposase [Agaribacterium sp. ZY112]|uniref:IS3 family transposase n=1 Tax=Agaribacterium sp. ZY112 TaxID=3233574 RepID=UPI0035255F03
MCRLYDVSRDGFNSWRRRGPSLREQEDAEHLRHEGCYGSPQITREMRKLDVRIGQKRVARIMRDNGLKALKARMCRTEPNPIMHTPSLN